MLASHIPMVVRVLAAQLLVDVPEGAGGDRSSIWASATWVGAFYGVSDPGILPDLVME